MLLLTHSTLLLLLGDGFALASECASCSRCETGGSELDLLLSLLFTILHNLSGSAVGRASKISKASVRLLGKTLRVPRMSIAVFRNMKRSPSYQTEAHWSVGCIWLRLHAARSSADHVNHISDAFASLVWYEMRSPRVASRSLLASMRKSGFLFSGGLRLVERLQSVDDPIPIRQCRSVAMVHVCIPCVS